MNTVKRVGGVAVQATITFAGDVDGEPVVVTATKHFGGITVNGVRRVWDNRLLSGDRARDQAVQQASVRFHDLNV
jgi:hypothetical protein